MITEHLQARDGSPIDWMGVRLAHTLSNIQDRIGFEDLMDTVLPQTPPEVLLHDYDLQLRLRDTLVEYQGALQRRKNPPIIELYSSGTNNARTPGYTSSERNRVNLADPDHIYFFAHPEPEAPHSALNALPVKRSVLSVVTVPRPDFTQFSRVRREPESEASPVEIYNYRKKAWQPTGRQEFLGVGVGTRRENLEEKKKVGISGIQRLYGERTSFTPR